MTTNTIYAKHKGPCIWEVINDNKDETVDLNIDDIQGDIMICGVPKKDIIIVDKSIYDERINDLKLSLNSNVQYNVSPENEALLFNKTIPMLDGKVSGIVAFRTYDCMMSQDEPQEGITYKVVHDVAHIKSFIPDRNGYYYFDGVKINKMDCEK